MGLLLLGRPPVLPLGVVDVAGQGLGWRVVDGAAKDHCHWGVRWFVLIGLLEVLVLESGYYYVAVGPVTIAPLVHCLTRMEHVGGSWVISLGHQALLLLR